MKISKITPGFVIQVFDTDSQTFTKQNFVAGDQVDYENEGDGSSINHEDFLKLVSVPEPYLSFNMVQPKNPAVKCGRGDVCVCGKC